MANLAFIYHRVGQHGDAIQLGAQTIEVQKRVLGAGHPDTLESMQNLDISYQWQNQYERGVQLGEQMVKVQKRV